MTGKLYTETIGCTTHVTGDRGTTTALHRRRGNVVGAFVKEDEGGMHYVTLGAPVGERGEQHEVVSVRQISCAVFDQLVELDVVRHSLGWRD